MLIFFGAVIVLSSCNKSKEHKAENLIKDYIEKNANDPSSYEAVEFGKLDTFSQISVFSEYYNEVLKDYNSSEDDIFLKQESSNELSNIINDPKQNPLSYSIKHSYRIKNAYGARVLVSTVFYLNQTLDSIIHVQD